MPRFAQLLLLLVTVHFFLSCKTAKQRELWDYRNSKQDGNRFSDSLLRAGVDTLIIYYDGGGYMGGLKRPYYIFWIDRRKGFLTKFDNYSNFNILDANFNISLIVSLKDSLVKTEIKQPNHSLSHDSYDELKIKIGSFDYRIGLTGMERGNNILSYPDILIDKFRSFLLDQEGYWRGLSYKVKMKKE